MSESSFEIDADIRCAWTPPSRVYNDVGIYGAAKERIFARSWQLVGHVDDVRTAGQVHPFTMLDGSLDEPLLLVRDRDDALHCLSNVCTHRGMIVCEHGGVESSLRCRYHGRRFGLGGAFESMPEFEEAADFPAKSDDLSRVSLERWGPFLFAAIDPVMSFDEWIGPVRDRVGWLPLDEFTFDASRSRDYLVGSNWALYCENYLEGFHIPFVHASLNEVVDYGSYRTELSRYASLQLGFSSGGDAVFEPPEGSVDAGTEPVAYYYFLFPNLMLNFYPWGLSINVVKPVAIDRTRVSFTTYVMDASKLQEGAGVGLDRVEREDEAIVELVQKGVRSRLYDRGRYSPTREQGTHHFHRLLAEFL
jgi:phenylpropionate dioxygenase-like ring-hydroxylating dioxygenase large terminal subunit